MSKDSVPSAAGRALEELLEVSPQVDAAVILERDGGRLIASAPASSDRVADRLASTCVKIVDAAEQSRRELGREPISQVEVATPDGHVFVVTDTTWIVAAVTDADPTVGLVFYDLKTALRAVREAHAGEGASSNGSANATVVTTADTASGDDTDASGGDDTATSSGDDAATSTGDEQAGSAAGSGEQSQPRWRRRKQ